MLTLDPDTAVLLAVDATRGMLDACLRGSDARSGQHVEVTAAPTAPAANPETQVAQATATERGACPVWRASQVRRAYLSTLPPPPDEPPGPGCKRWA